jgi:hypothetical protein
VVAPAGAESFTPRSSAEGTLMPIRESVSDTAFWIGSGRTPATARPDVATSVPTTTSPTVRALANLERGLAGAGGAGTPRARSAIAASTACCSRASS